MSAHTPGPWAVGPDIIGAVDKSGAFTRHIVAKITPARLRRQLVTPAQVAADYRLIAAAPELLEALRALLSGVCGIRGIEIADYCPDEVTQAAAAIAKATGDAP